MQGFVPRAKSMDRHTLFRRSLSPSKSVIDCFGCIDAHLISISTASVDIMGSHNLQYYACILVVQLMSFSVRSSKNCCEDDCIFTGSSADMWRSNLPEPPKIQLQCLFCLQHVNGRNHEEFPATFGFSLYPEYCIFAVDDWQWKIVSLCASYLYSEY